MGLQAAIDNGEAHDIALSDQLVRDRRVSTDAYCSTGSVRHAATRLHLHHSSVARRLENIGKRLGMELTTPSGLVRGQLALTAWRLRGPLPLP
ncbi:helix-turn-helix domain-containing protein [Ornithinimicrobium faecis]|uniref:Helix-turn-helix domain-containing protein n=1 Tax=Ornithinimicrobium faecis TaxID=2934158 RepID=A0ABY4YNM6_9MICO|nr:helix-turn-helix domain-containing protein [Ornithinimicrobium sp. HY1793]USQ78156.1 helix-turn-helix domain-containing protein [Ornithinimicrobium sp. HY1793]